MIRGCKASGIFKLMTEGNMSEAEELREGICPGGKMTGGNMSGVSKITGGNMCGREFVRDSFRPRASHNPSSLRPVCLQLEYAFPQQCLVPENCNISPLCTFRLFVL